MVTIDGINFWKFRLYQKHFQGCFIWCIFFHHYYNRYCCCCFHDFLFFCKLRKMINYYMDYMNILVHMKWKCCIPVYTLHISFICKMLILPCMQFCFACGNFQFVWRKRGGKHFIKIFWNEHVFLKVFWLGINEVWSNASNDILFICLTGECKGQFNHCEARTDQTAGISHGCHHHHPAWRPPDRPTEPLTPAGHWHSPGSFS